MFSRANRSSSTSIRCGRSRSLRPNSPWEATTTSESNGEYHLLNPLTISKLQQAVRQESFQTFQEYTDLIDKQSAQSVHAARLDEVEEEREARSASKKSSPLKKL